jgi:tetratricopeptide (TPR) repeat protein
MNKIRYIFPIVLVFLFACNDDDQSSPFSDILSQSPYASLTDSIKKQPKNDDLYFRRAVLLNKNNFPEPALADFQKAWTLSKQEKYALGIAKAWMDKKPDSAVIFLNEALKQLPKSYLLQLTLARSYDALNKTNEALEACNQLLQALPDQPEVLVLQSELLYKKGDSLASVVSLEKAVRLVPHNFNLAFTLADKYAATKNSKAITLCDSLIIKDSLSQFAEPYYFKGLYYANTNNKVKALQLFDETIKHGYNFLNAYIEKGRILLDQKKTIEAYKVFNLANTIKPSFPDAYYWMAVCQEELKQTDDALSNYEKAYQLDKTFIEAKEAAERLSKVVKVTS